MIHWALSSLFLDVYAIIIAISCVFFCTWQADTPGIISPCLLLEHNQPLDGLKQTIKVSKKAKPNASGCSLGVRVMSIGLIYFPMKPSGSRQFLSKLKMSPLRGFGVAVCLDLHLPALRHIIHLKELWSGSSYNHTKGFFFFPKMIINHRLDQ